MINDFIVEQLWLIPGSLPAYSLIALTLGKVEQSLANASIYMPVELTVCT